MPHDNVGVDVLAGLLDGPRAHEAFLLRVVLDPPWSIRVLDESPIGVVAVTSGELWAWSDGGVPVRLGPGDVGVFRGPDPYTVADAPGRSPNVVVLPGQQCTSAADGHLLVQEWDLGIRSWGTSRDGSSVFVIGAYEQLGEISRSLLAALPPFLAMPAGETDSRLVELLVEEVSRDLPGQRAVLDRLLDLVLVSTLRSWFAGNPEQAPAWYTAHDDPVVGTALRLLHRHPAAAWTVGRLATESGTSRAVLARRFHALVGEPPMGYLTRWRLALAADLLHDPAMTVDAVARRVGYSDGFALSTAFKRVRGVSPREHRTALAG